MLIRTILFTAIFLSALSSSNAKSHPGVCKPNEEAPAFCKKTMLIHAKPECVWAVLTNINNWNSWLTTVSTSKLNGTLQPNTTFDWKTAGAKIHSTIHTVDPYSNFGWTGKVYGVFAIHNWTFKETDGGTEVTVSESMQGFLAAIFRKYFNRTLENDMVQSLQQLKKACE